jgi:beta-1,4-mannosyl-glycoprotein beta-1,4-N-acetylglucosaminyltransferase
MPKVFDCFTFFNELDLLEIRLHEMDAYVDQFVLAEATQSFMGHEKTLHFQENKSRFEKFLPKITHIVVDDMPQGDLSPWTRESFQRNALLRGLTTASKNDLVILSDVDEIIKPHALNRILTGKTYLNAITFFEGEEYNFKYNWKVPEGRSWGSRMIEKKNLVSTQHLRKQRLKRYHAMPAILENAAWRLDAFYRFRKPIRRTVVPNSCWHFSFLMTPEDLVLKVKSYSHQNHNNPAFLNDVTGAKMHSGISFRGQQQLIRVDVSTLPDYIIKNQEKFSAFLDFSEGSTQELAA